MASDKKINKVKKILKRRNMDVHKMNMRSNVDIVYIYFEANLKML